MESGPQSRRSSTSQNGEAIEKVQQIVKDDHHVEIWEIVHKVGKGTGSVYSIVTNDLYMSSAGEICP